MRVLDDVPLAIDPEEALRFQGYKRGRTPAADVARLLDDALTLGRTLMRPRAALRTLPVQRDGDRLVVGDVALTIPRIADRWAAVEEVTAGVCTIGDPLERRVAELWEARELPLAMMLDSVGSAAVESLAEHVNDRLCAEGLRRGLKVTNRVSPGYGDWDVAEQRLLWRLCPGEAIGVRLNEACFMTPTKTITILVGAGVRARVDDYFSQCARCWMRDCAYRRVPARATVSSLGQLGESRRGWSPG
jgi:hypothetical protein